MVRKIAIIDDDASERLVLKGLVEEAGYSVVAEGADGAEAVKVCEESLPDIVIMDVKMPVKDGIEATAELQRVSPAPVVLLTADTDAETVRRAAEAGVMAYLVKPVRGEDLIPAIELAIERYREFGILRRENEDLKKTLLARKSIEKAKGLLMEREKLSESEAFSRIRKISMDKRQSMTEIAEVIILAFEASK